MKTEFHENPETI